MKFVVEINACVRNDGGHARDSPHMYELHICVERREPGKKTIAVRIWNMRYGLNMRLTDSKAS